MVISEVVCVLVLKISDVHIYVVVKLCRQVNIIMKIHVAIGMAKKVYKQDSKVMSIHSQMCRVYIYIYLCDFQTSLTTVHSNTF